MMTESKSETIAMPPPFLYGIIDPYRIWSKEKKEAGHFTVNVISAFIQDQISLS